MSNPAENSPTLDGACHCGRVAVHVPPSSAGVVVCHCEDCQKLHGGPFAMLVTDRADVRWEGEAHVQWYRSSPENERGFCVHCGSRVAKRPLGGTKIMVSAGLFGHALPRSVVKNVWLEQKPAWVTASRTGPLTPDELVALALAEPIGSPTAEYGYSLRASSGNSRSPLRRQPDSTGLRG